MIRIELSAFSVILGGFALWVLGLYFVALRRSFSWRKRDRLADTLRPQIRDALVEYLAGKEDRTPIRELLQQSRRDVGEVLVSFQSTVAGAARDRLCDLALELALVHDWCQDAHSKDSVQRRAAFEHLAFVSSYEPCRRVSGDMLTLALGDEDSDIRFSAALGVLQAGEPAQVERVFQIAVTHNLLIRILLTEELRHHANLLCERVIPEMLAAEEYGPVLATLEILNAWQRAVPLQDLSSVNSHPDRAIRLQALRLTSLVPLTPGNQGLILDSLGEDDPEVAIAACHCVTRLHIEAAMPGLARCLRCGATDLARAAAAGLAELPPRGWTILQELSTNPNPVTASAAREALARARERTGG